MEHTFEFESARTLGSLFLNDLGNLQIIERTLGVRITTREGWLRVEGEAPSVEQVGEIFRQLNDAQKSGLTIRKFEFNYALRSVQETDAPSLDALVVTKIQCSAKRPPIVTPLHHRRGETPVEGILGAHCRTARKARFARRPARPAQRRGASRRRSRRDHPRWLPG